MIEAEQLFLVKKLVHLILTFVENCSCQIPHHQYCYLLRLLGYFYKDQILALFAFRYPFFSYSKHVWLAIWVLRGSVFFILANRRITICSFVYTYLSFKVSDQPWFLKKYILCAVFSSKGIITFPPPWYLLISQCTIANKNASITGRKRLKKFDVAILKNNPEFRFAL